MCCLNIILLITLDIITKIYHTVLLQLYLRLCTLMRVKNASAASLYTCNHIQIPYSPTIVVKLLLSYCIQIIFRSYIAVRVMTNNI